ncbi:MAG: hypothetical protein IJ716_10515 [Lachnospiraceae bacterium]|nr:hypothetical protein [Lachnospiraceae bacterium]
MAKRKKRSASGFWIFYACFVAGMVIFWLCAAGYVKKGLVKYEENQPERTMDGLLTKLSEEELGAYLNAEISVSRFETQEDHAEALRQKIAGKELSYRVVRGYQNPSAPEYELLADEEPFGHVTLKEISAQPFLKLLTISQWAVDRVEIDPPKADLAVEVSVPDTFLVYFNGIPADDRELVRGEEAVPQEFTYAAEYVKVPQFLTYHVEGLVKRPVIEIRDRNGASAAIEETEQDGVIYAEVAGFAESSMPEELSKMALQHIEQYTDFFSGDLPGSHASVKPLQTMFPEDSYYLEMAETYRKEDMWMYSSHDSTSFQDEVVDHYIRYNDELFSCEVSFTKKMRLTKWDSMREDKVHFKVYYGMVKGEWKILDLQTLVQDN